MPRSRWLRRSLWIAAALAATLGLAYAVAPFVLRWRLERWLTAHGEKRVRIDDVDFNLFTLRATIKTLVAEGREQSALRWRRIIVAVALGPLRKHRLEVQDLELKDAVISVVRSPRGGITVGGLELGNAGGWQVGLENVATCASTSAALSWLSR